jgi:tetratricopeptide (TPR) repeat protein
MAAMEQAVALLGAGRFHEALQLFGAALRDQPLAAEPRVGLSQACEGIGDPWAAAAWLSDACRVAPQRPELWMELTRLLLRLKRDNELEPLLQTALAVNPGHADLLRAQAELNLRSGNYAKALPAFARLHALDRKDRGAVLHHGYCLEHTGDVEQAIVCYREALALDPLFLEAHVDLAGVLWRVGDFDGALLHARKAVDMAPEHPYAVRIVGTALLNLNRIDEAKGHLRKALKLLPEFALAELDLAFASLLAGEMDEGWRLYARRWRDGERMKRPTFFQPDAEWKGRREQPLRGRRIAIYAEQGFGDVIQFIRYATLMQEDGATVYAVVHEELAALIEGSMPGVLCLTPQRRFETELHVALMDLPMHYGTRLESIPAATPYLKAPENKVSQWREKLQPWSGKFKVGLAWTGSPKQVNNVNRAIALRDLIAIADVPGVQCFSLQKMDSGELAGVPGAAAKLVDLTGDWRDFTDSAAMLRNLDLVITVDTAIAHLAGALASPVWVMLAPNADWRWLLQREDSPWYPTMRLFRRDFGEARVPQVARVAQALRERLARRSKPDRREN